MSWDCKELEIRAAEILHRPVFDYIAGGAGDESSLRLCENDLQQIRLVNRALRGIESVDLRTNVLGQPHSMPLLIAPTAYQSMVHPEGEIAMAKAAGAVGTSMILSTLSTQEMEMVQNESKANLWFQLYFYRDRGMTQALVERAERAGYRAIVLTVDVPVLGIRYRDRKNKFQIPEKFQLVNILAQDQLESFRTRPGNSLEHFIGTQLKASLSWDDISWLRSITSLPILLKGILHPEDARIAAKNEIAAVVVSNHGARQLDALVSPCRALPKIRDAVDAEGAKMEILVDGGVRSGSDVLRYLCLGANAVLIGRPTVWALAVGGSQGVQNLLLRIKEEIEKGMFILGARRTDELNRGFLAE